MRDNRDAMSVSLALVEAMLARQASNRNAMINAISSMILSPQLLDRHDTTENRKSPDASPGLPILDSTISM